MATELKVGIFARRSGPSGPLLPERNLALKGSHVLTDLYLGNCAIILLL